MKLQSLSVIFVFGVLGIVEVVSGLCLVTNTSTPEVYWYRCYGSNNYLTDVEAAPVDIQRVTFNNAKIQVLRNRSFARLSSGLEELEINYSEIGEIEDNAFEGLAKLELLSFSASNLKIVKGLWFKGLTNLKRVLLQENEIKNIESSFFSTVPSLDLLDVTANKLECLPVDSFADFETKKFLVDGNPFGWMCLASLMDWLSVKNVDHDYYYKEHSPEVPPQLLSTCTKKQPKSELNEESIKKCAENTAAGFLKPEENYTVKELCQFLKNNPSPYLECPE